MPLLETFTTFIIYTAIPILILFILERTIILKLTRSPAGIKWIRRTWWMHPNSICRMRYPMGIVSIAIYHAGSVLYPDISPNYLHHISFLWFSFWIMSDISDGTIARHCDLRTKKGESIDPLSDKLLLFPILFYFAYLELLPLFLVFIFFIIDFIGQISRFFIKNKGANLFGKAKTFLTVITVILISMQQAYFHEVPLGISKAIFYGTVLLGFCSVFFKVIPNYWYANILSILNLICGIGGIILILLYNRPGWAFALVFLGQFLDMFDGRAAEKWGSTKGGELLDDLADGTNFGGTISLIIYSAFKDHTFGFALGAIYFLSTAYRLVRFVLDKRKDGVKGGVAMFAGLPSPAAALVVGSVALLEINLYVKIACIIGIAGLMISRIPYIHFGRVILPAIPKIVKLLVLTLILLAVIIGLTTRNQEILYWTVFACSFAYLVFGYPWRKFKTSSS